MRKPIHLSPYELHQLGKDREQDLYILSIRVPCKHNEDEERVISSTKYNLYMDLTVHDNTLSELKNLAEEILTKVKEAERTLEVKGA